MENGLTEKRDPQALDDTIRRNEVKTRLTDLEYEALQSAKRKLKIDSDGKTLQRMARIGLFGAIGQ